MRFRSKSGLQLQVECTGADGRRKWRDTIDLDDDGGSALRTVLTAVCLVLLLVLLWAKGVVFAGMGGLVVTAGLNKLLDATFKTGLASPAWYVGLKDTSGGYVAGDTMASHAGWADIVPYSDASRPAFTPGTISAGSVNNSGAKATFNINASATVYGAFLCDNNTKSGTTGTLYGVGDFSGGAKSVTSGDTLNVTVTLTQTAA